MDHPLRRGPAADLPGDRLMLGVDRPFPLDCGASLGPFPLAYQTYGTLSPERDNAILVCHALTGDQFVAEPHPVTGKPGWWAGLVGPGRPVDTDRFFVVCANVLGGCMGSAGPAEPDPATGAPWGLSFPLVTIGDMVRAQKALIDALGIPKLRAVIGGSMGGMQVLQWAADYPERIEAALPIATAVRHSAQNIAFHEVGRRAVMADPVWDRGRYITQGTKPVAGLSVARMAAHVTYLSDDALHRKFGRRFQDRDRPRFGFEAEFQVESYLRHQGIAFVDRFDANSYLYITRAMDYFDLGAEKGRPLAEIFRGSGVRFAVVSFSSDWLFPTAESRRLVRALTAAGCDVSFVEIETDKGHDAFLLDEPEFHAVVAGFLRSGSRHEASAAAPAPRPAGPPPAARRDLELIATLVPQGATVLDVGCGDGELLALLRAARGAEGRGLELEVANCRQAVAQGLAVVQGDANTDLIDYPTDAVDLAILSKTLPAMRNPAATLAELVRIGRRAIVSITNFGHWSVRASLAATGRMPVTRALPHPWWATPDIHPCTVADFVELAERTGCTIEATLLATRRGHVLRRAGRPSGLDNLRAEQAVFLLRRGVGLPAQPATPTSSE